MARGGRAPRTLRAYSADLQRISVLMGEDALTHLNSQGLRAVADVLEESLPGIRSRARALSALRSFLAWAAGAGRLPAGLASRVRLPRLPPRSATDINRTDVDRVLADAEAFGDSLRDLRDRAMVGLFLDAGCKTSELTALDRRDLLSGARLRVGLRRRRVVRLRAATWRGLSEYLDARGDDASPALFISLSHSLRPGGVAVEENRLTPAGVRTALNRRAFDGQLARAFDAPRKARHTVARRILPRHGAGKAARRLGYVRAANLDVYLPAADRVPDWRNRSREILDDGVIEAGRGRRWVPAE